MRAAGVLALAVGALAGLGHATHAQGFGFLFGEPERGYGHRSARRPHPRIAAVPLPVPRPHFSEDAPPNRTAPSPARAQTMQAPSSKPAAESKPEIVTPGTARATPPLPPEKPPLLAAPPASDATKPVETGQSGARPSDNGAREAKPPSIMPRETQTDGTKPPAGDTAPSPAVAPSGATTAFDPRQPAADAGCPARLRAAHVDAAPVTLGPQPDQRCVVMQPVKLDHLSLKDGSRIDFPDRPTIACTTADTFATYVRDLLVPLAKGTYGVPLDSVWTGPGLECRSRDHIFGAKLSAHGQGLAIDVAQLKLAGGRVLAVGEPKDDQDQAFETAARAGGCGYFHTVLGPGSDSYHRTHWHFDLEERGAKGDGKFCK